MKKIEVLPEDLLNPDFMNTPIMELQGDFNTKLWIIVREIERIENVYLKKYGEDSLDRILSYDPRRHTVAQKLEYIAELEEAIETNTPIEQVDPEIWKNLIF